MTADSSSPLSATIRFGNDSVGSSFPTPSGHDQSGHARDSLIPRTVALTVNNDIVIWETARPWASAAQMTFTPAIDWFPVWMPDSKRIVFGSWRGGRFSNLFIQEPGQADAVRLTESPDMQLPTSVTPDGSTLIFHSFMQRCITGRSRSHLTAAPSTRPSSRTKPTAGCSRSRSRRAPAHCRCLHSDAK